MSSIEHAIIRGVPLFAKLDDAEIERLAEIITVRGCLAGIPLFETGDVSDAFYIISRGTIRIKLPQKPNQKILLNRGDFFGEMGVVRGTRRSADAIVEEDSVLLEIKKDDFDNLMALDADIAEKIVSAFIDRCNAMTAPETEAKPEKSGYIPAERACRVITVFSPSGGGGATTLAINMAVKTRQYTGKRVLVIDGDLQLGTVHMALNSQKGPDTTGIFNETEISGFTIEKYRRQLHYGIDIIPSPLRAYEEHALNPSVWRSLVNNAAGMYDYLFIDTCSELSELNLGLFELSDDILFLMAPEVISVKRVVMAWDFLRRRDFPLERIKLVLNRFRKESMVKPEDLEERFGKRIFGRISLDPAPCIDALNEGTPLVKRTPKVQVAIDLSRAIRQLLCLPATKEEQAQQGSFSLWNIFS